MGRGGKILSPRKVGRTAGGGSRWDRKGVREVGRALALALSLGLGWRVRILKVNRGRKCLHKIIDTSKAVAKTTTDDVQQTAAYTTKSQHTAHITAVGAWHH